MEFPTISQIWFPYYYWLYLFLIYVILNTQSHKAYNSFWSQICRGSLLYFCGFIRSNDSLNNYSLRSSSFKLVPLNFSSSHFLMFYSILQPFSPNMTPQVLAIAFKHSILVEFFCYLCTVCQHSLNQISRSLISLRTSLWNILWFFMRMSRRYSR